MNICNDLVEGVMERDVRYLTLELHVGGKRRKLRRVETPVLRYMIAR